MRAALLIVGLIGLLGSVKTARGDCVDEELKENLFGRRANRGTVPRRFQKALRHEFTALGGWMAGDLADGVPIYGGAYSFYFSEELGIELSYLRHRRQYGMLGQVLDQQGGWITLDRAPHSTVQTLAGNFLLSLAYGKVRWLGGAISAFDLRLNLGAGAQVVPRQVALLGEVGLGFEVFFNSWLAARLDLRDWVHAERAPLGTDVVVNDLSALAGLSVFLPLRKGRPHAD